MRPPPTPQQQDEAQRVCDGVLWLAANIHNYGTDAWRGYFMACVRDARRVRGYEPDRGAGAATTGGPDE